MATTDEQIELMRAFVGDLTGTGIITHAWLDDWGDYSNFQFGVEVETITPHSTNSVKAAIRRTLELQRFADVRINLSVYNAPRRIDGNGEFWDDWGYSQTYWMFDAEVLD